MAIVNVIVMYGPAIRKALARKASVSELKALSRQAKATLKKQGNLAKAVADLDKAIAKMEAVKKKAATKKK